MKGIRKGHVWEREKELLSFFVKSMWTENRGEERDGGGWEGKERKGNGMEGKGREKKGYADGDGDG